MCPGGFKAYDGDIEGPGINGYSDYIASFDKCVSDCKNREDCKSFIHSKSKTKCKLMNGATPTNPKAEDYQFCSKGKYLILKFLWIYLNRSKTTDLP